jgi:hypothetical protein
MRSDNKLEQLLRKAPAPSAPFGLEQRLVRQASKPKINNTWSWLSIFKERRWAPALALILILAGLLTVLGFQQNTLSELNRAQRDLATNIPPNHVQAEASAQTPADQELEDLRKQSLELQKLRAEMADIGQVIAHQPEIARENAALRSELSSLTKNNFEASPEFQTALAEARKRAERIKCVNNLKMIGLAARIWANDDTYKTGLPKDFLIMTNELSTPRVLICPSDPARPQTIDNWQQFKTLGSSYEILSPGVPENIPTAVYARCPIHNNVCRADGSVIQLQPDQQLVQRNGYWEIAQ